MPKIIDNAREKILAEAKTQLFSVGYEKLMLKRVACACDIAVGTIYNYFPSKDMLAACVMMEDWHIALHRMKKAAQNEPDVRQGLQEMFLAIQDFCHLYEPVWQQYNKGGGMPVGFGNRRKQLRQQINICIETLLKNNCQEIDLDLTPWISELLLSTALSDELTYAGLEKIFDRLFTQTKTL